MLGAKESIEMRNVCYLVVPCYNEEKALPKSAPVFLSKIEELIKQGNISGKSKIMFVDDGSKDKTWDIIEDLHKQNPIFIGLKLSRNCGHQKALFSGLMFAKDKCDLTISIDSDLQDDINAIDGFIEEHNKGAEIVFGVRSKRDTDTIFKRNTALIFYKLMQFMGVNIIYNHADYRLMSKNALGALSEYKESNLFLRAVVAQLGFKTSSVYYERNKRVEGTTKYPFKQMLAFAFDGISSFSIYPIRIISALGIIISILSSLMFAYYFIAKFLGNIPVPGYASLICSIWLLGGLQLLSIGVIGEYIGKTYLETKQRPRYIIEKVLD